MKTEARFGLFSWRMHVKAVLSLVVVMLGLALGLGTFQQGPGLSWTLFIAFMVAFVGAIGLANSERRWFKFTLEF